MSAKKIERALQQPFSQNDLEWRIQSSGDNNGNHWARIIAYVTNRAIQNRLDDTVGVFGWKNEFSPLPNSMGVGALCGISLKFDNEWITKYDGADNTIIEGTKGGISGSMKRAAVQFGIGRYLYDIESCYAECINDATFKTLKKHEKDRYDRATDKNKKVFYWKAPTLDDKFLPKKHLTKATYDIIQELMEDTETDKKSLCEKYGVDDLKDLYTDEAGKITDLLVLKKSKLEEKDATDKKD